MSDRQIDPLDKSGVQSSRETQSLQAGFESGLCSKAHHLCDSNQLAPSVAFLHLAVDQARCHLPLSCFPPLMTRLEPLAKMSRQRREIQIEPITREQGYAARGQHLSQRVDELVGHVLCSGAEIQHGQKIGAGING